MPDVRLIDANALKRQAVEVEIVTPPHNHYCSELVVFGYDIDEAPTIDAVPVVRCRECVHNEDEDVCPFVRVDRGENWFEIIKPHPDGFCHMGAKMGGGAEEWHLT